MKMLTDLMLLSAGYNAVLVVWWMWAGKPQLTLLSPLIFCFPWLVVVTFFAILAYDAADD